MKKLYVLCCLFCFLLSNTSAQTVEQAKAMFSKGEYAKAMPVFKKLLAAQPANATYSYWYGLSLLKNGDFTEAIKPLEVAVQKRVSDAPLYLGQAYHEAYRFEDAVKCYEGYIETLSKKKQSVAEVEKLLERSKTNLRMLKGVEEVCIIDSFVVSKEGFLKHYKLSQELGRLFTYNEYFKVEGTNEGTVFETELENRIYYSEQATESKTLNISSQNKMLNQWSNGVALPSNINSTGNANYPFVLSDGVTIYYAADGEGSIGGYDIFVTRYNTNSDTYLTPENRGMPFNSPYNDYMYVIDEYSNLGWFASDRYQPQGRVCIYLFIPKSSKQIYNYETMDSNQVIGLARIDAIKDTWKDKKEVEAAKKRLKEVNNLLPQKKQTVDFQFIINDQATYYRLSDFKSAPAKNLFLTYQQKEKDFTQQDNKLTEQRQAYERANKAEKERLSPAIIDLEKNVRQLSLDLDALAIRVRNAENTK